VSRPGKAGRNGLFREILEQAHVIRAALRRWGVPADRVPDLTQETLLTAWQKLAEFRAPEGEGRVAAIRAWLYVIARNIAHNERRRAQLYARILAGMQHGESNVSDPETLMGDAEVLRALGRLKAKHREILALVGLGYTAIEIAVELGIPETAAAARIQDARVAFLRALVRWRR
jgi:RNA polymerase sigma-70 factor (ECF subfamily)